MFTIWPSTVWTSVAQPTEQKGQTLGVTFALAIRSASVCASTGWRLTPDAIRPPSAVPLLPATEKRRISRREISIAETPFSNPAGQRVHKVPASAHAGFGTGRGVWRGEMAAAGWN